MKKNIGGVPQQIRGLTVLVYERAVESAIGRGLLGRGSSSSLPFCPLPLPYAAWHRATWQRWRTLQM